MTPAEIIAALIEPPFADTLLHVGLAVVSFATALALGVIVYLLALFGPGMRL